MMAPYTVKEIVAHRTTIDPQSVDLKSEQSGEVDLQ